MENLQEVSVSNQFSIPFKDYQILISFTRLLVELSIRKQKTEKREKPTLTQLKMFIF